MSAILSKDQKRYLAQQADRALAQSRARGEPIADCGCGKGPDTSFRHNQVIIACNKHGLRCCTQDDYGAIKGRFLDLLGEPGRGMKAMVHGDPAINRRRIAEYKLSEACTQAGVHLTYAEAICRTQHHGATLSDIDEKAIWRLVYTIRARARSRKQQQAA